MGLTDLLKALAEKVDLELEREEKRTTAAKKSRAKVSRKSSLSKANGTWIGGVRSSHIPGFRIVKKFDSIRVASDSIPPLFSTIHELDTCVKNLCGSPSDVKEELEEIAKKLGANGFVNFHWNKRRSRCIINSYKHKLSIDASYDPYDDGICLRDGEPYRILKDVAYDVEFFDGTATPVIFEPQSQKIPHTKKESAIQESIGWPTYCVIDGSNIIREHGGTVEGLSACYFTAKGAGCRTQVFLDANIFHVIKEGGTDTGRELLELLIKDHQEDIRMVPAGSRADDFILQSADSNDGHVVSNDRYLSYANRYSWIAKGYRLHKFMFVDGHLMIPDFGVDVIVNEHKGKITKEHIRKQPQSRKGQREGKNGTMQPPSDVCVSTVLLERVKKAYDWNGSNIKKFLNTYIKNYGSIFGRFSIPDNVREITPDYILEILHYGFSHQEEYDPTFADFCKMICRYHYDEYCTQCKELKIVRDAISGKSQQEENNGRV